MHMYYLSHNFFSGRALDALASNPGKRERGEGGRGRDTSSRFILQIPDLVLFLRICRFSIL